MSLLKVTLAAACILLIVTKKPKPTLYIIGDSTVKNGTGDDKTSLWGWGSLLSLHFDTTKIVAKEKGAIPYRAKLVTIAENGWANNSINTVIFRKNSLTTHNHVQYAAYYDEDQYLVLAKRESNSEEWTVLRTEYKGDATDAHKSISIIVDGDGYVHVAWGQHNNSLNYAVGVSPGSLELSKKIPMLSSKEEHVSYPEFYNLSNGDILFLYRDGGSGNGNLMLNRYDVKRKTWMRVQDNMIDGQGRRNAYWQMALDQKGTIHLSWVWRESPDVASNHDMCYAKSSDGGKTWQNSEGTNYTLPITESNAEYACKIPQKSELINQTSMFADDKGQVFIASYWRKQGQDVPQYHIIFKDGNQWKVNDLNFRSTSFSLSGGGTKRIPISRPQIIAWNKGKQQAAALIFRDSERGNKVSLAMNENIKGKDWIIRDLTETEVGDWEPSYDTELWKKRSILNLFIQKVTQVDGEGKASVGASAVQVLEWKPKL